MLTGKINLSGEVAMRPITEIVYLYNKKIPVMFHSNYSYNKETQSSFKGMEINLPNNTAWKKSEPPKLSDNHDTKMNYEKKTSSKRTLVWAVFRKHSEKGETIVPAWACFKF